VTTLINAVSKNAVYAKVGAGVAGALLVIGAALWKALGR
jgi:hypothetical protein